MKETEFKLNVTKSFIKISGMLVGYSDNRTTGELLFDKSTAKRLGEVLLQESQ